MGEPKPLILPKATTSLKMRATMGCVKFNFAFKTCRFVAKTMVLSLKTKHICFQQSTVFSSICSSNAEEQVF